MLFKKLLKVKLFWLWFQSSSNFNDFNPMSRVFLLYFSLVRYALESFSFFSIFFRTLSELIVIVWFTISFTHLLCLPLHRIDLLVKIIQTKIRYSDLLRNEKKNPKSKSTKFNFTNQRVDQNKNLKKILTSSTSVTYRHRHWQLFPIKSRHKVSDQRRQIVALHFNLLSYEFFIENRSSSVVIDGLLQNTDTGQ